MWISWVSSVHLQRLWGICNSNQNIFIRVSSWHDISLQYAPLLQLRWLIGRSVSYFIALPCPVRMKSQARNECILLHFVSQESQLAVIFGLHLPEIADILVLRLEHERVHPVGSALSLSITHNNRRYNRTNRKERTRPDNKPKRKESTETKKKRNATGLPKKETQWVSEWVIQWRLRTV